MGYSSSLTTQPFSLTTFQGRFAEAEQLLQRSLAIRETALGPAHPYVAESLGNLAVSLKNQVRVVRVVGNVIGYGTDAEILLLSICFQADYRSIF